MAVTAPCPECEENIVQDGLDMKGQLVVCPSCGTELEVINTDPFTLDIAPKEMEDFGE